MALIKYGKSDHNSRTWIFFGYIFYVAWNSLRPSKFRCSETTNGIWSKRWVKNNGLMGYFRIFLH